METPIQVSKWSNRFVWAAIIQGLAATLITVPIFLPSNLGGPTPAISYVIASGSAGTWFLTGYVMYLVVGVLAVGLTALFYYHFEVSLRKPYKGISNAFAWVHLVLMNVGAAAATWMLMYGGYLGERALLPTAEGGLGWTTFQVHTQILSNYVNPIGFALALTAIGVLAGGIGFLLNHFRK